MMRKRVLTYSLAVAMAVAMAVPQTVILSTGILNLLKWINLHLLLQIIAVRSIKL